MARPELSVIVPVRDGADTLPALLGSLARQTLAGERFEVIVVDNASTDQTAAVARALGARVVAEPVPSRARARNAGAAAAATSRFAFTDADCVAGPRWLEALLDCAGVAPLVAGPVTVTTSEPPNSIERFERLWRFGQEAWVRQGWAATANLVVEREAFEAIGGFDEAYRHIGEDADLCVRAIRAGFALGYCPDAEVLHAAEDRLWPMLKRAFWHGYSSAQVSRRVAVGYRAWRRLRPLFDREQAAGVIGIDRARLDPPDRRRMGRLAQAAYALRVAGSLWSELEQAR